jgi:hypothetical protein
MRARRLLVERCDKSMAQKCKKLILQFLIRFTEHVQQ